jgi:hypothetical protein
MSFVNYDKLQMKYLDGRMRENVLRLQEFDVFHCLLASDENRAKAIRQRISNLPDDFCNWVDVCDGGMLFDTELLSTKTEDNDLELEFSTYAEYNKDAATGEQNIPGRVFVFAVAVHSDLYYFNLDNNNGAVYQWDVEEQDVYAEWGSFEDWLTEQIDEALDLIAREELDPLDIKIGDNSCD